jgi:cysteine-rich repeat protein
VAVVVVGTLNLSNSILADNTIAPTGFGPDCNGNVTSQGFNLLGDNTDCTFSGSDGVNGDDVGTGASPIVPGLSPLQDNGGPTETHALEDTSPAIDSGDDASCEPTDQRGDTRPTDGDQDGAAHCDKGAFELGRCGDGVTQPDEQCDDGNTTNGDGCNSLCEDEPDNGNDNNNGGCSLSTSPSLPSPRAPWALLGLGAMGAVAYFRRGGFIR